MKNYLEFSWNLFLCCLMLLLFLLMDLSFCVLESFWVVLDLGLPGKRGAMKVSSLTIDVVLTWFSSLYLCNTTLTLSLQWDLIFPAPSLCVTYCIPRNDIVIKVLLLLVTLHSYVQHLSLCFEVISYFMCLPHLSFLFGEVN